MSEAGGAAGAGGRGGALALAGLLVAYLGLAIAYQRAVPLFEAPDEQSHIHYLVFLAREGRPPRALERQEVPGEGMQPPLYYTLLLPLTRAIDDARDLGLPAVLERASLWTYGFADADTSEAGRLRVAGPEGKGRHFVVDASLESLRPLRWGSLPFGLLAVWLTFVAARRASGSASFGLLCGALFGLSPQFLFVSAYVNNDVASAALGAAAFLVGAVALERERVSRGSYLAAGALCALGLATKHSALPPIVVSCLALFAWDRRALRMRLADAGLAAALTLALAAPVLLTNLQRFGDLFGVAAVLESAAGLVGHEKYGGTWTYLRSAYPVTTFCSYWGVFGWLNVYFPMRVYLPILLLVAAGALGYLLAWRDGDLRGRALRRYVLACALAVLAAHLWINLHAIACQGRHLFAAAPQIAALLALGISRLASGRALAPGWLPATAIAAGMAALALYGLTRVIAPVYG